MKRYLYIMLAVLAYVLLSSKSCESTDEEVAQRNEARLMETVERMQDEFESADLSEKSLRAFEVKAGQKLIDLADYLDICFDKPLDASFKNQARRMIRDLFISDSVEIGNLLSKELGGKNMTLGEFPGIDTVPDYNSIDFTFDSVEITKPLRRTDETTYKGALTFYRSAKFYSSSDTTDTTVDRMQVDILATRVNKTFGADTLRVWSVFLGSVRLEE